MDFSDIVQTPATAPDDQTQKKPFWQVLNEHRQATSTYPELKDMSVPEFAQRMNEIHGGNQYDEGLNDSFLRRAGANIEIGLRHFGGQEYPGQQPIPGVPSSKNWSTPSEWFGGPREGLNLPELAHKGTESVATGLGAGPELAQKVGKAGESLPSTAFAVGTGLLAGIPTGGAATIPTIAALSGLQTYGETGRKLPALVSAGSAALFPKAAELGGEAVLKSLGAKTLAETSPGLMSLLSKETPEAISEAQALGSKLVPSTLTERVGRVAGAQAGMLGLSLGSEAAQTAIRPNETWQDKLAEIGGEFAPSSLIATAVGQLPFTALDVASLRTHPVKALESQVRQNFGDRFTQAYQEDTGGKVPDQSLIDRAIEHVQTGKQVAPDSTEGRVLASIGQAPVQFDLSRPVKTAEGDWNTMQAIESVRSRANNMLQAQENVGPEIGNQHDLSIYAALRAAEGEGRVNKETLTHLTASRVVDMWRGDQRSLSRLAPVEPEKPFPPVAQQQLEARIAAATTPTNPDGSTNPLYDHNIAQRIALVSGDEDHRLDVGIQQPPIMSVRGKPGQTQPLTTSIIDAVRGLVPKVGGDERDVAVGQFQERLATLDTQIADEEKQGDLFDNRNLDQLRGERERVQSILSDLQEGKGPEQKTRAQQLTADSTAAARYRAFNYPKKFDVNDPNSVSDFYNDIKLTINQAELGWLSRSAGKGFTTDEAGNVRRFASREEAQTEAGNLNETTPPEAGLKYSVSTNPEPDGTFRVLERKFHRFYPLEQEGEGEHIGEEPTEPEETGVPVQTLSEYGAITKELEQEALTERFQSLSRLGDPAVAAGRKAALAQNVIDYVTGLPDSLVARLLKEETGAASIRLPATLKARYVRFMQFLRDGGDVRLDINKTGDRVKVKGEGDLDALNTYMGDLGFTGKEPSKRFNEPRTSGLNFFEQFYTLSKYLQRELPDPRIFGKDAVESRPRGDFGWVPPGFRDDIENKLTVSWPPELQRGIGVGKSKWGDIPDAVKDDAVVMRDSKGNTKRFEITKNPLVTMFVKGARYDLSTSAGKLVDMFDQYAPDVDKEQLSAAKLLVKALPFIRNQNVGFGVAKDPFTKGYWHADDVSGSAGMLLSPFEPAPTGKNIANLMQPKEFFPHFLHELGHAATHYGYMSDPALKTEVDRVFDYLKGQQQNNIDFQGGKFVQNNLHALENPSEMLASVWHDGQFQEFLKGVKDPFEALPQAQVGGSLFDRVMAVIRGWFTKLVGDHTDTMLARVSELASRSLDAQKSLNLQVRGDIYKELYTKGKLVGDVLHRPAPEPVPQPISDNLSRTWLQSQPKPLSLTEILNDRESALADAQKKLDVLSTETSEVAKALVPQYEADVQRETQAVTEIQGRMTQEPTGQVLESRVDPTTVVDSLKASSTKQVEDKDTIWFKPYNLNYFRDTYSPAFGKQMQMAQVGGEWGYAIPKLALSELTKDSLDRMPPPKVRTWTPSAFETLKSLFRQQGSDDKTSEALAGYNVQYASLLQNSERAVWGELEVKDMLGAAWGANRVVGLTKAGVEDKGVETTVRHESAHASGFHDEQEYEAPDVLKSVALVNQTFEQLGQSGREAVLEGLARLSEKDGKVPQAYVYTHALTDPREFAAEFMAHVGDMLGNVPKPSVYLQEVMRFAPDEVANLVKTTALRRAQGFNGLKELVNEQARQRGIKSPLNATVNSLVGTFREMGRSALNIALDQAEFYRMRMLYPDMYRPLLQQMADRLDRFATQVGPGQPSPRLPGTLFESRESGITNDIRKFFRLPTADGRLPDKLGIWDKYLTQFSQFADKYPVARPFYDMLASARGLSQEARIKLKTALAGAYEGGKVLDDQRTKQVAKFNGNQRLKELFSKVSLDINQLGDTKFGRSQW